MAARRLGFTIEGEREKKKRMRRMEALGFVNKNQRERRIGDGGRSSHRDRGLMNLRLIEREGVKKEKGKIHWFTKKLVGIFWQDL